MDRGEIILKVDLKEAREFMKSQSKITAIWSLLPIFRGHFRFIERFVFLTIFSKSC